MRKPNVKNKYNLDFHAISKLIIADESKICEPLFWRNDIIHAWCNSGNTIKSPKDSEYGTYNEYWIGIYDKNSKHKNRLSVECTAFGGMALYKFKKFFNPEEIENNLDLEIQEKLLAKINEFIDIGILKMNLIKK